MQFTYRNRVVKVYRQHHPQYPPWVATITYIKKDKVYFTNVEAGTMEQAADKAKRIIEQAR